MREYLTLIAFFLISVSSFAQPFEHPVDYNNFIVEEMNEIVNKNLEYISQSVHSENFEQVEVKRKGLVSQIKTAYNNISQTDPYEKGEKLQSECVAVLNMYKQVFEIEFQEVNVLKQSSQASYEAMEAYFLAQDKAEKNLSRATERFYKAQKSFIKSHNIKMQESTDEEASEQFKAIAEVNEYTRELYLIYFQMSKYSSIFFEAVGQQEKAGLEGKRKRLEAAADRALAKMNQMKGFKGDTDLLNKTKTLAKFHKDISMAGFADIVKVIRAKQEDLTQKDVDSYNAAIELYNSKIQTLTNDYNEAQAELMKKHIPKHKVMNKNVKRT